MKRSEVNLAIKEAIKTLDDNGFRLPSFAYWTVDEWKQNHHQLDNLREVGLGWDVTDFGTGNFAKVGAVLFTVRNGSPKDATLGTPYAEKIILLKPGQEIPFHYHVVKTEDIINRGGGVLVLELYNSAEDGGLDRVSPIHVKMDGILHTLPAGAVVEVEKGNSITLHPGLYHRFWAKKDAGDLIVGEVSSVNDDETDNVFLEVPERFARIEENVPAEFLLCSEY